MDKNITDITPIASKTPKLGQDTSKKQELYNSIVGNIKKKYNNKISESEAHEAARNLIDFYKELLK